MKMTNYVVSLDGIDKSGKTTLTKYLAHMSNFTLNVLDRGPVTNLVWNKIQGRDISYDLEMWKTTLFVRLNVDEDDWNIRCKIYSEPPMPYTFKDMNTAYDEVFEMFRNNGFYVLEFNTSKMTQHTIATKILKFLEELNLKK